jgi:deoxyhypusine synthase
MKPVKDIRLSPGIKVSELVEQFREAGGFSAKYLGIAVNIFKEMIEDEKCVKFISFVGAPVATGLRGVIAEAIRRSMFDVVVTTCGAIDHDIARSLGQYYDGDFWMDDEELRGRGIHRLGSVLIPLDSYGPAIERFMQGVLEEAYSRGLRELASYEICELIGGKIQDEGSILYWAHRRGVKVFVPGIMDGAVGTQLWLFQQRHRDFRLNLFKDADELAGIIFKAERTGALMIGGGISKHHTLWWNQFREGLDYAIYLTTACEYDGSLSGARVHEAISWMKVKAGARKVTVYGDATITLPLIIASVLG